MSILYDKDEQEKLAIKLRQETGVGIMDCRLALKRNDWNYELAKIKVTERRPGVLYD